MSRMAVTAAPPPSASCRFQDHPYRPRNQLLFRLSCVFSTFSHAYTCMFGRRSPLKKARGGREKPSSADSDMDIARLPSDILVEVTADIATRSATPLIDIVNLRRSCKVFRDATAAREVGRCMAVQREWRLHWWDKARFLSVLRRCAASGNPEASYILGLEEFCNGSRKASGLRHLRRAMEHGHAAAAYMMGMITLHHPRSPGGTTDTERALERLDLFCASAGPRTRRGIATVRREAGIATVRREAASVMRRLTLHRWRMAEPPAPCADPRCGEVETAAVAAGAWDGGGDDDERRFCSRTCRWRHEYRKFVERI